MSGATGPSLAKWRRRTPGWPARKAPKLCRRCKASEQLDGGHLQGVALHFAGDVCAQMVLLVRRFQGGDDLRVPVGIELEELLVVGNDDEATLLTLEGASPWVGVGIGGHFLGAIDVDHRDVGERLGGREHGHSKQAENYDRSKFPHISSIY